MKTTSVLSAAALCLLAACADTVPVEPTVASLSPLGSRAALAGQSDEASIVSPALDSLNQLFAAAGLRMRIAKAEVLFAARGYQAATSTVVFANDRARGTDYEWVKGDPRRGGRQGVTYAVGSNTGGLPITFTANGFELVPAAQVDAQIEEGMDAWRNRSCSSAAMTRVAGGVNPDVYDEVIRGFFPPNWTNPADIVHGMWQPQGFFRAIATILQLPPEDGDHIIGITLSVPFTDENGVATDIDGNGKADLALAEIYYNRFVGITPQNEIVGYLWSNDGAPGYTDFFSILAHETGHALGLNHFGKVFVTRNDIQYAPNGVPFVDAADVKYAPKSLMNAVYVTGRNEITGTDNSSFCQIWASRKK